MSTLPDNEPVCAEPGSPVVELTIRARTRDLGEGFSVRRLLPAAARRRVGPFTFLDHMGPMQLPPGRGLDVRPHPHIGLATVTYLLEGALLHRDSLGSEQLIEPGAVNWMTAGRGVVHSERSPAAARAQGAALNGLQLWVALPVEHEQIEPSFVHHDAGSLPSIDLPGARLRIIAGSALGATSPVKALSPLLFVDASLEGSAVIDVPDEPAERALYVAAGAIEIDGEPHRDGTLLLLRERSRARACALEPTRLFLLGGAPLTGERHLDWNFVSSSRELIERAREDWRAGRFPKVPGDEVEFVPLPDWPRRG
jgi:redox-sensitive bicupin YhaK (pirin superfamily)